MNARNLATKRPFILTAVALAIATSSFVVRAQNVDPDLQPKPWKRAAVTKQVAANAAADTMQAAPHGAMGSMSRPGRLADAFEPSRYAR